ncbi:MAG: dihydropteroate synthase [Robiginitomaculum sp.]
MTRIMGILNVTPDSFSDGGRFYALEQAVTRGLAMIDEGADILDIGGESTRPGAQEISVDEELSRTIPVITALRAQTRDRDLDITLSIDTRKSAVASAAIHAGADIWNDVSALSFDENSLGVAAELGCPVILMHAQGRPETMQDNPQYHDVVADVCAYLSARAQAAIAAGIEPRNITLDPGIGFGKSLDDNLALIARLAEIKALGYDLLMGASRKSFIGRVDGSMASDRLGGSLAAALFSLGQGADIVRVHDVSETVQAALVWRAIEKKENKPL